MRNNTTSIHRPTISRRAGAAAAATLAAAGLALTGCAAQATGSDGDGWTESPSAVDAGVSPVLLHGDSVAAQQAVALRQGLAESGAKFIDATSTGGGNVVGPNSEKQWNTLPDELEPAAGGVVIYQVTTYDWGTPDEQRTAYERLADTTEGLDADLVLVSVPPIRADDFYRPHMDELATANESARAVAEDRDGVTYLDASEVWGDDYARERDGRVDRSEDGIHTCPQSAARFTAWLLDALADLAPGFAPADPDAWANTGWADSDLFHGC